MNSTSDVNSTKLWIFGYGSLCWHPGFEFSNHQLGYIRGFSRKFWQGNTSHRGTEQKPGRVATLIEEEEAITWGRAFELVGEKALEYLEQRECKLGGYRTLITTFYPRNGVMAPLPVFLYIATPDNNQWMGPAPLNDIAAQVTECRGHAGHNIEYVIRLADFFRDHLPEVHDDHLFSLEASVRQHMKQKEIVWTESSTSARKEAPASTLPSVPAAAAAEGGDAEVRRDSFQHQSRLAPKKLLCLKV